jgi:CubicO group peptidase (beta-lactamase class C family)
VTATQDHVVAPAFAPVERAFRRLMGPGRGGGALVVRQGGEVVVRVVAGHADRRGTRPWTPETLAVSFSTSKGAASTVVHRLADRGLLGYDDRVADHWPAFAAGGKEDVTVRHLLTHRAGLSSVRAIAERAEHALDHRLMEERLAARAVAAPRSRSAYHAITYGWLVAGLVRAITGQGLQELVRTELAEPLGVDGLHIGAPETGRERIAEPVGTALRHLGSAAKVLLPLSARAPRARAAFDALHLAGFDRLFEGDPPPIWDTEMPAVNGIFSADGLASLYAALASDGDGLLSPETTRELGRVQVRTRDVVLALPMRWRLGYHQAFGTGSEGSRAFGHFGYGGSGAWADPSLRLAVGFVTNRIGQVSTPLGDLTLYRLNRVVHECARRSGRPVRRPAAAG